jgi:hypothetical protein
MAGESDRLRPGWAYRILGNPAWAFSDAIAMRRVHFVTRWRSHLPTRSANSDGIPPDGNRTEQSHD